MVSISGFGAIPTQRITFEDAKLILYKAYENGINFFDTAAKKKEGQLLFSHPSLKLTN
jgi:aryl-alcohol dehydrogenase-like predicted oxidoreductase